MQSIERLLCQFLAAIRALGVHLSAFMLVPLGSLSLPMRVYSPPSGTTSDLGYARQSCGLRPERSRTGIRGGAARPPACDTVWLWLMRLDCASSVGALCEYQADSLSASAGPGGSIFRPGVSFTSAARSGCASLRGLLRISVGPFSAAPARCSSASAVSGSNEHHRCGSGRDGLVVHTIARGKVLRRRDAVLRRSVRLVLSDDRL